MVNLSRVKTEDLADELEERRLKEFRAQEAVDNKERVKEYEQRPPDYFVGRAYGHPGDDSFAEEQEVASVFIHGNAGSSERVTFNVSHDSETYFLNVFSDGVREELHNRMVVLVEEFLASRRNDPAFVAHLIDLNCPRRAMRGEETELDKIALEGWHEAAIERLSEFTIEQLDGAICEQDGWVGNNRIFGWGETEKKLIQKAIKLKGVVARQTSKSSKKRQRSTKPSASC